MRQANHQVSQLQHVLIAFRFVLYHTVFTWLSELINQLQHHINFNVTYPSYRNLSSFALTSDIILLNPHNVCLDSASQLTLLTEIIPLSVVSEFPCSAVQDDFRLLGPRLDVSYFEKRRLVIARWKFCCQTLM